MKTVHNARHSKHKAVGKRAQWNSIFQNLLSTKDLDISLILHANYPLAAQQKNK